MLRRPPRSSRAFEVLTFAIAASIASADALTLPLMIAIYLLVRWPRRSHEL